MRSLNLHVTIPSDRKIVLQLPDDIDPGETDLTVIVRRRPSNRDKSSLLSRLPNLHVEKWPEGVTFSRSELYDDDGR